jgi:tetratricopeptide (TPR) repeat protein/SAM-dependent methyltransferase
MSTNIGLSIEEIFNLAVKNHTENNLSVAEKLYIKVLEINPKNSGAYNNLGTIFKKNGNYLKAKINFQKAIEIIPDDLNANYNLGIVFYELGETEKAINSYKKVIEINPTYYNAYYNLGLIYRELQQIQKSLLHYRKAFQIDPSDPDLLNNLGKIYKDLKEYRIAIDFFNKVLKIDPNHVFAINNMLHLFTIIEFEKDDLSIKELILFLYKNNNIDHNNLIRNAISILSLNFDNKQDIINSKETLLKNNFVKLLIKKELFHLMLQKSVITDIFCEKLLTKLRSEIIFFFDKNDNINLKDYFDFIISLAEQCWLNEYIHTKSLEEIDKINQLKDKIEKNTNIDELEVAILACYIPLNYSKIISDKLSSYKSTNNIFNDLIKMQIKEPLKEIELKKTIKSLNAIDNSISKKVKNQYDEHPYPRWRYTYKYTPRNFFSALNSEINPNEIQYNDKFVNPKILIAGCGTGKHLIATQRFLNAKILGVDLSLTSLSYAKRKIEELGHKNVEFLQADILHLNKINRKFDIIESVGTLHHMENPVKGLKILLELLEPHGFLRLGLYSHIGRKHIIATKKLATTKKIKNTVNDIKVFRKYIINENKDLLLKKILTNKDFYTTTGIKDLLFHVQEHRFTIPEISEILKSLNLEFLGFNLIDLELKKRYSKYFPQDKKQLSLNNWHQFETENPDTFSGMYQFWLKKIL